MTTLKPSVVTLISNKDEITTFNQIRDIQVTTEQIQNINNLGKFALE